MTDPTNPFFTVVSASQATGNPDDPNLTYIAQSEDWALVAALLRGARALRNETLLPRHGAESDDAYKARAARTFLYNGFRKAVRNITGRIFAKPITVTDDMPDLVKTWVEDIDLKGCSIDRFARTFFFKALAFGKGHIFVDFTRVPAGETLAGERALNARPYFVHVPALNLIDWEESQIAGETVYTYARILEPKQVRVDFGWEVRNRVRELVPGSFKLWEQSANGWSVIDEGPMLVRGAPLDRVPLVKLVLGEEGMDDAVVRPPLIDLAEKNQEHFQSASDQRNILTFARFPMLAHSGQIPKETDENGKEIPFKVGPRMVLQSMDPQSKYYYVEPEGKSIEAGREDLKILKQEMEELGMQPLLDRVSGDVLATVALLGSAEAHSVAQAMAIALKDAIDQALWFVGQWSGIDEVGSVLVNGDFVIDADKKASIDQLQKMRAAGDLSRRTLWLEMQRKNVLSPEFNADDEEAALSNEPDFLVTPAPAAGDNLNPGGDAQNAGADNPPAGADNPNPQSGNQTGAPGG